MRLPRTGKVERRRTIGETMAAICRLRLNGERVTIPGVASMRSINREHVSRRTSSPRGVWLRVIGFPAEGIRHAFRLTRLQPRLRAALSAEVLQKLEDGGAVSTEDLLGHR
jgi:hypothetical protein